MRLTVIGCSGSYAGPTSPASCYLLEHEDAGRAWRIVLDLGNGALGVLQRHTRPELLDAVLLTHHHPDHLADMCGLFVMRKYRPGGPPPVRLPVYGPEGTDDRLAVAYGSPDAKDMARYFDYRVVRDAEPFRVGPFRVTPFRMNHPVESYGFRIACGETVIAYTGDTDTTPNLSPLLTGADLALMDSAFVDGRDPLPDIHLSGSRAAQAAVDAGGVRRLMLTHLPAWNDPAVCHAEAAAVWPGDVEMAQPEATYDVAPSA